MLSPYLAIVRMFLNYFWQFGHIKNRSQLFDRFQEYVTSYNEKII